MSNSYLIIARHTRRHLACAMLLFCSVMTLQAGGADSTIVISFGPEIQPAVSVSPTVGPDVIHPEWYSMVTNIPRDLEGLGNLMSRKENYPIIAGVSLMTIGMHAVDDQVWSWTKPNFHREQCATINNILVGMGDGRTHLAVAGAFAAAGYLFDDQRAVRTASQTVEAVLATGLIVQAMKRITGRESPVFATRPAGKWQLFPNPRAYQRHQTQYYSFPSGHTAATMAVVTVIAENYPEFAWMRPAGFAIVGLVELGLVNAGMHWYGDFPVAMLLGYSCGMIVSGGRESGHDGFSLVRAENFSIQPVITPVGSAVGFSLRF